MSDQQTALLVIDAQQSFRHRGYWVEEEAASYFDRQQALIDGATARGIPVIQIFHDDGEAPFSAECGHVRTLDGLRVSPDAVFVKSRHSAFAGTALDIWLTERGINRLIVSGIRTEQCCETTTRHGSDMGYRIDYVTEATLTFAMTHADGTVFTAADIAKRTELVLAGRFARIVTVAEALGQRADIAA